MTGGKYLGENGKRNYFAWSRAACFSEHPTWEWAAEHLSRCQFQLQKQRTSSSSAELTKVGWRRGWKITGITDSHASQFTGTCNVTAPAVLLDVSVSWMPCPGSRPGVPSHPAMSLLLVLSAQQPWPDDLWLWTKHSGSQFPPLQNWVQTGFRLDNCEGPFQLAEPLILTL